MSQRAAARFAQGAGFGHAPLGLAPRPSAVTRWLGLVLLAIAVAAVGAAIALRMKASRAPSPAGAPEADPSSTAAP
jgi:hypothetical protein